MDDAQPPPSPVSPIDQNLKPTTDLIAEDCPRFRILIVGQSGVGKSSLINAIFKASLADVQHHNKAGTANINEGITSPHNRHLIIHDSEGYTPGDQEKFSILEKFITERSQKETVAERLHAIWLCIMSPYTNGKILHPWDEKIFQLNQHKVPIIVVYTKFDLFMVKLRRNKNGTWNSDTTQEDAEKNFNEKYGQSFASSTKDVWGLGQIPYTVASIRLPDTLPRLVDATMRSMHVDTSNLLNRPAHGPDNVSDSPQIALATAQRVDMPAKIIASIRVGKKKYWRAIASGLYFLNLSLQRCLYAIHKDIVTVWNIRDLDEILISDKFSRRMMFIVEDLNDQKRKDACATQSRITLTSAVAGITKLWTNGVYKQGPEHIRCLMGYVVDLTLILQAVFHVSITERLEKNAIQDRLNEILYEFHLSERKKSIHDEIRSFVGVQHPFAKDSVVDKIESLIKQNEMTLRDTQLDQERSSLLSLLRIVDFETLIANPNGPVVNQVILNLVHKVLDSPDYGTIPSELENPTDIQVLLDFILYLLLNSHLSRDANRKARRLMFKLMSKNDVLPKSLSIRDVKFDTQFNVIAMKGFGRVFKGEYEGKEVALKELNKGRNNNWKAFCWEAVGWRSLGPHSSILPLLGIFEEKSQLYFVLPFTENGTLTQWRRDHTPRSAEVHRWMQEVAEGMGYIHSEGLVHGDLRGENILLNSNLHCQIADIALTQNSNPIRTLSASGHMFNYAAPELFAPQSQSDISDDHEVLRKTTQTDVYAFGCLYYAIFFGSVPFLERSEYQIMQLVTSGTHPDRLASPKMEDNTWNLLQRCWQMDPSKRPAMEEIERTITTFTNLKT